MNITYFKKILTVIFCCSLILCMTGCGTENRMRILDYEEFCAAKEVMDTYARQAYEITEADMLSNQPIIDEYNNSKFQKLFANYSEDELNKAYYTYKKTAEAAESNGFEPSKYIGTVQKSVTNSLSEEYEKTYGLNAAEQEYRVNIQKNADKSGISQEDFINDIIVPYVIVQNFAVKFFQNYYFENIYEGLYKQMQQEYQKLWNGNDPYTSEAIAYSSMDEYQNAYVGFLKDYENFIESLDKQSLLKNSWK